MTQRQKDVGVELHLTHVQTFCTKENKTSRNTEQWSKVNDFFFSSNFVSEFFQTDQSEVFSLIDDRVY